MVSIENLEKELRAGKLQSIYLLYGEELFLLETSLNKIKKLFGKAEKGINYITIDDTNISGIIADIETPAFGYEKKLIIARNTGLFKREGKRKNSELSQIKEKLNDYLKENYKMIQESVVIVFVEQEVDARQKLYRTLEELACVCKFDFQKPFQIEKRVKAICHGYKVEIEDKDLKYFIECCGTNMQDVINEIRKLIEYAGENGKIEREDIDKLTIKKLESIIFDLTDSLGKKEAGKALDILHNLIDTKEPVQKILITLYNHFKRIYFTKLALKGKKDVIQTLNLKPNQTFLINKYKSQASYFKEIELKEILQSLRDLDYEYKNGLIDLQIGLESILCRYCS